MQRAPDTFPAGPRPPTATGPCSEIPPSEPARAAGRPPGWERQLLWAQVRALYREGDTLEQIATKTGYTARHISRIVRQARLPRRLFHQQWDDARSARAIELGRAGLSLAEIGRQLGGDPKRARALLVAHGIRIRPPGLAAAGWRAVG
jgi:hypothetical protein